MLSAAVGKQLLGNGLKQRKRPLGLCLSEIMTILIGFHCSSYRNFAAYSWSRVAECSDRVPSSKQAL
ncbi:hypothetical protein H6F86_16575 [Phormidium sp. FACHB-592]|uniref:Transposase n=1 Tax=Stenomitos frigidus AS-A4 TaxID=2933935 RepID=A0ABV0KS06_9CYAN|nr:hypothetical protein [Phormidium sp. FACHB-592]MBD2075481.1 hypothetical protein [Phormidium sp. FACHB-592]